MAKPRYKSKHSGTARNTLSNADHAETWMPGMTATNTPLHLSLCASFPKPFKPHIFRRLTIASGTTTKPNPGQGPRP